MSLHVSNRYAIIKPDKRHWWDSFRLTLQHSGQLRYMPPDCEWRYKLRIGGRVSYAACAPPRMKIDGKWHELIYPSQIVYGEGADTKEGVSA